MPLFPTLCLPGALRLRVGQLATLLSTPLAHVQKFAAGPKLAVPCIPVVLHAHSRSARCHAHTLSWLARVCKLPPGTLWWCGLRAMTVRAVDCIMLECHTLLAVACGVGPPRETPGVQAGIHLGPVLLACCSCLAVVADIVQHQRWPLKLPACPNDVHHVCHHRGNLGWLLCCHHTSENGKTLDPCPYIWNHFLLCFGKLGGVY